MSRYVSASGHPKVGALSPELLAIIFQHHQSLQPPSLSSRYRDATLTSMNAIIASSRVCKSWRRASLGSQALWSNINLNHKAANTFLMRSANQPLRLYLFDPGPNIVSQTNIGLDDGNRVRELVLRTDNDSMEDITDRLGHMLLELVLALLHVEPSDTGDVFVFNASNIVTPKLRILRTFNIDFTHSLEASDDLVPGQLSGLTFLELSDTQTDVFTAEDIIQLIHRCPNLEFLHFDERVGSDGLAALSEDVVVTLDRLKGLHLRDFHYAKLIFQHIRIPAHAPLLLEVDHEEGKSDLWGDFVLEVNYPDKVINLKHAGSRKPCFVVHLEGVPNAAQMASLIPMLGTILDFQRISKLTIKCPSDQDESLTWRNLFYHFPSLQSLRMLADKTCITNVLHALWASPIPCPKLDNLYIKCDPKIDELDWLEGLLDLRSRSGLPLLKNLVVRAAPKENFVRWAESVEV